MIKFVMRTCFLPSIRLSLKVLQIQEFLNMLPLSCLWVLFLRDCVPINRTIHTSNVDKLNEAYTAQKEHNYIWLPF